MDPISIFEHRERTHSHIATAPVAERADARRHVRAVILAAREKRDAEIASAEADLPVADAAFAKAEKALEAARNARRALIGRIDAASHEFASHAGVLEQRLQEYVDPGADGLIAAQDAVTTSEV
jgi:hypothetical protein